MLGVFRAYAQPTSWVSFAGIMTDASGCTPTRIAQQETVVLPQGLGLRPRRRVHQDHDQVISFFKGEKDAESMTV